MKIAINFLSLVVVVFAAACSTAPSRDLDISLSEAGTIATNPNPEDRVIRSETPWPKPRPGPDVDIHVTSYAGGFIDPYWAGSYDHRFLIGRQNNINIGVNRYNLFTGYQLTYAARMTDHQFHFSFYFTEGEWQATQSTEGLSDPWLVGVTGAYHQLIPYDDMAFAFGGEMSVSALAFDFDNPLFVDNQIIESDSIGVFGLGVPVGVLYDIGNLTAEVFVTPTWTLHSDTTEVGFTNNIVTTNVSMPVSVAVGWTF